MWHHEIRKHPFRRQPDLNWTSSQVFSMILRNILGHIFYRYPWTATSDANFYFFSLKTQNLDTPYILLEEFQKFIDSSSHDSLSILHLNIRSIKNNFDNFELFFSTLGFSWSVISFSETWLDEVGNSLFELPNYISKHQVRDDRKRGGVSIYIHNSLRFKVLSNLSINSVDIESLSIELSLYNKRSTFVNVLYRPPNGKIEPFETFLAKLLSSVQNANKDLHIAGDSNLNLLDDESNKKVHDFLSIICCMFLYLGQKSLFLIGRLLRVEIWLSNKLWRIYEW